MTAPPDAARASSRGVLYGLLVALVTLLAFRSILAGAFVYDDLLLVAHNPLVASFGNLGEAFARPYWEGLDPDGSGTVGLWRPLTTVALMIGHAMGGGAPAGFHWVSLLLHLAAALAALRLATCVTGRPAVGLWTALLFAVHPVHVESVAWISGVCDPLAGVCGLLALSSFWSWRTGERGGVPWAAGLWFLLGLLAKETALATLPMVLVLDLLAPASERRARLRGWFPLVLAFVLYTFARMLVFGELTAGFLMVTTGFEVSAGRLAALRVELLGGFLQLLAWPLELNLFRPFHPELPEGDPTLAVAAVWSVLCLGLAVWLVVRRHRTAALAWLLVPASLLPLLVRVSALGIFPLADRYLYLAVFGFALALTLLVRRALPAPVATGALAVVVALYAWGSIDRTADWRTEVALFDRAAEQSPRAPYVAWERGRVYLTRYRETKRPEDLATAKAEYERGMELLAEAQNGTDPTIFATRRDYLQMNMGLAWCYLFEGELDPFRDFETPKRIFESVVQTYPQSSNAHVGLAVALTVLAERSEGEEKATRYQRAGEELREALRIAETDVAHSAFGQLLVRLGDFEKAVREFELALELRPGHLAYQLYLVQALEFLEDDARVRTVLERAHAQHPEAPEPMRMLGSLAVRQERLEDALRWFELALERDADDGHAHLQRGIVLARLGRTKEAMKSVLRACELRPGDFEANYNAAVLLLQSDAPQEAQEFLLLAYRLRPEGTGSGPGSIGEMLAREVRKIAPDDAETLWLLAEADRRLGQRASALDWVERALRLDPDHGYSLYTRAMLREDDEEGRASALTDLVRAAELLPENFDVQHETGTRLAQAGRNQEAIGHLLEALKLLPRAGLSKDDFAGIHRALSHQLAELQAAVDAESN